MKAMRRRIALQRHCVRNVWNTLWCFVRQALDFRSARCLPARVRASSRPFDFGQNFQLNCPLILGLSISLFCVTSCATLSQHEFSEPVSGWQTKTGQLMYRSLTTTLIGEALVRFSKNGDFQLTVSKGPGITLLSLRQDATFAEVKGAFARQGWSGPVEKAPPQLRGWLGLRDQFVHARDQKTLRYVSGNETFLFRF
jgi:hypothetical protein